MFLSSLFLSFYSGAHEHGCQDALPTPNITIKANKREAPDDEKVIFIHWLRSFFFFSILSSLDHHSMTLKKQQVWTTNEQATRSNSNIFQVLNEWKEHHHLDQLICTSIVVMNISNLKRSRKMMNGIHHRIWKLCWSVHYVEQHTIVLIIFSNMLNENIS